jgi:hypothetical protein
MSRIGIGFLASSVGIVVFSMVLASQGLITGGPFGGGFTVAFLAIVMTGAIGTLLTFMGWIHRAFGTPKTERAFAQSLRTEQAYGD